MKSRPSRPGFAFVLGLLVALGMSLSAVQASEMAVKMAVATDMSTHGTSDCSGGCSDGGNTMICAAACVAPVVAVLPPALSVTFGYAANVPFGPDPLVPDWASSPDPYPPRSSDLG